MCRLLEMSPYVLHKKNGISIFILREESVKTVKKGWIGLLDLSFNESDLEEVEKDGSANR